VADAGEVAGLMLRFILLAAIFAATPAFAADLTMVNSSVVTRCAEEDNVHVDIYMPPDTKLRVEAWQPVYAKTLKTDIRAPDFTNCDMTGNPSFPFTPKTETLYEDAGIKVVGITQPTFWRNHRAVFAIGAKEWPDLHFVQFFQKRATRPPIELLVVYPIDGYWRAKPPEPPLLTDNVYGSSFLIGPVEMQKRPIVDIERIVFDPPRRSFSISFSRGGTATARIGAIDQQHFAFDVDLDLPKDWTGPVVSLRSMYVTEDNADTAKIAWPEKGRWRRGPIMGVKNLTARELRFERTLPSRHNTSAPDLRFRAR
jgi:hypothetical protein